MVARHALRVAQGVPPRIAACYHPWESNRRRREGHVVPTASLLVIQGVDQGTRFETESGRIRIGRGAQNEIRILDTEVSRRHATLACQGDRYVLQDDNSSNGSFVNGQPVRSQVLRNGDQIQVGRTILLFQMSGADASSMVAERVDLLSEAREDRSQIIGSLDSAAGFALAQQVAAGVPPAHADSSLRALYRIGEEAVRPSAGIDEVLQRILELTLEAVGADRGCMLIADSKTDRIEPRVIAHRTGIDGGERMPISTGIVEFVVNNTQAVRTSDAAHDTRFDPGRSILEAGIREAMCVPMQGRYELLGVIYVDTTTRAQDALFGTAPAHRFTDELLTLLLAVGRQSALAVENNRYQQALVTAERLAAVGQTIATLSHHIKNILQGLRGGSYLVESGLKGGDDETIRKGWGIVEKNQNRIYSLVMDMLTFSKERRPELALADVNQVVKEVCELMQGRAEELSITLDVQLAARVPKSLFDAEGMHRAVLNIVTNAFDVLDGEPHGKVQVLTGFDSVDEQLFIEVIDNGPGIPDEELPRLFSLFESTKGARGTGLGLAVSQKILREHGGEISVESAPGQGTRFRLAWPLLNEERLRADSAEYEALPDA
jgi:signal transduction histidine kinase/pSer/pThr/pTyr-binding forkhead associated (FHA) protein